MSIHRTTYEIERYSVLRGVWVNHQTINATNDRAAVRCYHNWLAERPSTDPIGRRYRLTMAAHSVLVDEPGRAPDEAIAALRARRAARGEGDPLARLSANINRLIADGAPVIVEDKQ